MKVLLSGMTTRTVGSNRLKLNYINFSPLLKQALELLGHEVDQRRVIHGEDLTRYDFGFFYVVPGDKIVCQNILEVSYALQAMRGRAGIFLEDWITWELRQAWEHILNVRWEKWMKWKNLQWDQAQQSFVKTTIDEVLNGDSWPVLAPFFSWGEPRPFFERNFKTKRTMIIDPSSLVKMPDFEYRGKDKRWVLATLQKHDAWVNRQGFTWPVEYYGNERQGFPAIPEQQVTQRCAESWGVISPRYPMIGWFRTRVLMAMATGSILYCDPQEGARIDGNFTIPLPQVEAASPEELLMVAKDQEAAIRSKLWGKAYLLGRLSGFIEGTLMKAGDSREKVVLA